MSKKVENKVTPIKSNEPTVTIEDCRSMVGALTNNGYPTFKGRLIRQIVKDSVFAAYAYKAADEAAPRSTIADLEASCSPYKDGIDATLVKPERPELAGKKPRKDLIFDILNRSDVDPDLINELATALKGEAVDEQIAYITKRNMGSGTGGSTGVGKRVAAGLHRLEEMDSSWDEAFITKAASFLVSFTDRTFSDEDKANLQYMSAVVAGKAPTEEAAPLSFAV